MLKIVCFLSWSILAFNATGQARQDTLIVSERLLPEKLKLRQKVLWGPKGLLRISGIAPLTAAGRAKELKLRRWMLDAHQVTGYLTLGAMCVELISGHQLSSGQNHPDHLHRQLATWLGIGYLTSATLSLTAPPPQVVRDEAVINARTIHQTLATVHRGAMLMALVAGTQIGQKGDDRLHHWAAYTAFGAYATAIIVIKL